MDETHVVTAFLREGTDVLLTRRSDAVGTYQGRWAGVSGYAEGDPDAQVLVEIREETGLDADAVDLVRAGDPLDVHDEAANRHWVVHPYLFDATTRDVTPNEELSTVTWAPPTAIRERDTVPGLWAAYERVRPTVETIRADHEHGAAALSIRALDVLRDEAASATDRDRVVEVARTLLDARPDMAVLANRVNRAMHDAGPAADSRAVRDAAIAVARRAVAADDAAAREASALVEGRRVATLSRSGTVLRALLEGRPARVVVAESRPGAEGVAVAERLAKAGFDVTLTTDANLPNAVTDCDIALVGADSVHPDGGVVNKVGTRALALGAGASDVPVYACCATDKIATTPHVPAETADADAIYGGDVALALDNPRFDVTPGDHVTGIVTEDGVLDQAGVRNRADAHRRLADWA
jgi:translation initiation factor 2B subunit (eIF-2B alpha/beta/delta family)